MTRGVGIITLLALAGIILPAVLVAQTAAKPSTPLGPFKLTVNPVTGTIDIDLKTRTLVCDRDVVFVSPKTPPYDIEIRCQHLRANGVADTSTSSIVATGAVTFTAVSKSTDPKKPADRIKGRGEKIQYESIVGADGKTPTRVLRLFKMRDAAGNPVTPTIEVSQAGSQEEPMVLSAALITYDFVTGKLRLEKEGEISSRERQP